MSKWWSIFQKISDSHNICNFVPKSESLLFKSPKRHITDTSVLKPLVSPKLLAKDFFTLHSKKNDEASSLFKPKLHFNTDLEIKDVRHEKTGLKHTSSENETKIQKNNELNLNQSNKYFTISQTGKIFYH